MAELRSYELIGVKEQVADWISNLAPNEYPFSAMIGKSKATTTKFDWQYDTDAKPNPNNALMEGTDYGDLDDSWAPTDLMTGYTQILAKVIKVNGTTDAQANWGRGKESNYQVDKKGRELKSDLEESFLKGGKSVPEDKVAQTPRKLGGYVSMVSSIDGGVTLLDHPLYDVKTIIIAESDKPTADEIIACMNNMWKCYARPEILMCNDTMSGVISGLQESTNGSRARIFENTEKITMEVNAITDPLGQTVKVVYNHFMPDNTVYIFNPDEWQEMVLRAPFKEPLAKMGDFKRTAIVMEVGLRHRNPWASGAVLPKPSALRKAK